MHAPRYWSAGKTIHPAINFVTNLFESRDTNPPPQVCPPAPQAATHVAARAAFGRPCRCARERETGAHAVGAHAHARRPLPRLPQLRARREARRPPRATQLALAIGTIVRTRRHACFADGFRVALPVQAAAAASARARRPTRPRHLRHDRQAHHRQLGHDDPTMIRPPSRSAQSLCL